MTKRLSLLLLFLLLSPLFVSLTYSNIGFECNTYQQLPIPLADPAVAYYNGSIYVIGGDTSGPRVLSTVYIYTNGTWEEGPSLPFQLGGARAVVYNGSIYVVGGANYTGIFGGILELQGNQWVLVSDSMPVPVYDEIAFVYNNELYVIGGANFTGFTPSPPSDLIQVYSFQTGKWEIIGKAPQPLSDSGYYFNGSVLFVVGGYIGYADETPCVYEYFPENNSWVKLSPLPSGIMGEAVGYYRGVLYIVGGYFFRYGVIDPGVIAYYSNGQWYFPGFKESVPTEYSGYVQIGKTLYIIGGNELPSQDFTNAFQSVKIELPPPKPNIISYTVGNETVTLIWNDTDAQGYYVNYWASNGQRGSIETSNTFYVFTGLEDGVTYNFQIIPYNEWGNGTPSNVISLTPFSVPNPPIVKVKVGDRNATVSWEPTFNGGFPIEGYYLILKGGNLTFEENVGNITEYTFTGLIPGVTYQLEVIAYNKFGNSSPAEIDFTAVAKATISLIATKSINGILLSWNTTQPAKFVLLVMSNGKLIENLSLSNYSILLKIPFGVYNITLEAINQAGVSKTSILVYYYLVPPVPQVRSVINGTSLYLSWNSTPLATYYLVYVNGSLFMNTSHTSVKVPLSLGRSEIKVIAGNPLYESEPFIFSVYLYSEFSVLTDAVHSVSSNSTIIRVIAPATTNTTVDINLTSAIVIISLFILSLVVVMIMLREGEKK